MGATDPALGAACASTPGLGLLLGHAAGEVLTAAVDSSFVQIRDVDVTQISLRPGSRAIVQYRVVETDRQIETIATYVAAMGLPLPDHTAIVEGDGLRIGVWRYPNDPMLPGIGPISSRDNAAGILNQLGVDVSNASVRHRSYRPTRRAVLELRAADATVFAKVVPPARAERLRAIHRSLSQTVPVPMVRGWRADLGIIVLNAVPGVTLREALSTARPVPPPASITDMIHSLGDARVDARRVPRPSSRAREHISFLSTVTPDLEPLLDELDVALHDPPIITEAPRTIHGDLHASQLMTLDGELAGVIDVDRSGPGDAISDKANLLAHLAVLSTTTERTTAFTAYAAALLDEFNDHTDPDTLRLETAAAILGFATGPFRVLQDAWPQATETRLRLALTWASNTNPHGH